MNPSSEFLLANMNIVLIVLLVCSVGFFYLEYIRLKFAVDDLKTTTKSTTSTSK